MPVDYDRRTLAIVHENDLGKYRTGPGRWEFNGYPVVARALTPLDLMIRDDTLWGRLYAKDYLKKAIMLFCLSPRTKQDMMHIGIVSSVGEGKDHMIEHVIEAPGSLRYRWNRKTGDGGGTDRCHVGRGHQQREPRIATQDAQREDRRIGVPDLGRRDIRQADERHGQRLRGNQQGSVHTRRETCQPAIPGTLRRLRLARRAGRLHRQDRHAGAFGDYTYQIMSRLTLIFTQMSLAGDGAKDHIRSNILKTMDGAHDAKKSRRVEAMWRLFFREYLRAVSGIVPQIG